MILVTMMKNLLAIPLIFVALYINAQTKLPIAKTNKLANHTTPAKATTLIKGNVKNFTDNFWEIAVTGDFTNYSVEIPVDKNGNFSKTLELDGETEDIFLYFNDDAITICAQSKDTIEINWDNKDLDHSLRVSSPRENINSRLQSMISIYKLYNKAYTDLAEAKYTDKSADSVKFSKINTLYNKEMQTAAMNSNYDETRTLITNTYFKYINLLHGYRLLSKYSLYITDTTGNGKKLNSEFSEYAYKIESEYAFKNSYEYRKFISNYIRFNNAFIELITSSNSANEAIAKTAPFAPAWQEYYLGLANLRVYEIRDWFVTQQLMRAFENYSFDDASGVYQDFIPKIKIQRYADTLKQFYARVKQLKPGNMAPDFNLKNDKGQNVSLKSLRGKVVYIDFWGVGCGPCIYEIKNTTAAVHEKYKNKQVVFLNVCVDADEKTWKQNIASLKMTGTNVIAEGWTRNPICKKYNVNGIPHYYIIDTNGKIVNNNAPRPSNQTTLYAELDKALK
jgi:peroxiredoxin